jgi:hypothetical protein
MFGSHRREMGGVTAYYYPTANVTFWNTIQLNRRLLSMTDLPPTKLVGNPHRIPMKANPEQLRKRSANYSQMNCRTRIRRCTHRNIVNTPGNMPTIRHNKAMIQEMGAIASLSTNHCRNLTVPNDHSLTRGTLKAVNCNLSSKTNSNQHPANIPRSPNNPRKTPRMTSGDLCCYFPFIGGYNFISRQDARAKRLPTTDTQQHPSLILVLGWRHTVTTCKPANTTLSTPAM